MLAVPFCRLGSPHAHTHSLSTPTTKSPSLAKLPSEDDIVAMQWGVSGTLIISKLPIKSPTNRILETCNRDLAS